MLDWTMPTLSSGLVSLIKLVNAPVLTLHFKHILFLFIIFRFFIFVYYFEMRYNECFELH